MSYGDDDNLMGEDEFKMGNLDDDFAEDDLEPLSDGAINDFRFDEEPDEDPEDKYH